MSKLFLFLTSLLAFLSLSTISFAQSNLKLNTTPLMPKNNTQGKVTVNQSKAKSSKQSSNKVLINSLNGIAFLSSLKDFNQNGLSKNINLSNGLYLESTPLLNNAKFKQEISAYLHKPLTYKGLESIIALVREIYMSNNEPFVDVVAPPQNVSTGVIQILVVEYKVGSVKVTGNKYFSSSLVRYLSGIQVGQSLTSTEIFDDINWINQNPFIHTDAILSPGKKIGTMDVDLATKDVFPVRVYAGYDNQGVPTLDKNEWRAGFNYGNVLGTGSILSYQFVNSFSDKYHSNSLSYEALLPAHSKLEFTASYSVALPRINSNFSEHGRDVQLSLYYIKELPTYIHNNISIQQNIGAGYDYKTTNSNLEFGGTSVFNATAQIDQFPIFYNLTEKDSTGITSIKNKLVLSPGHLTNGNSNSTFNKIMPSSNSRYVYDNISISRLQRLYRSLSLYSSIDYQLASTNLLYSEQLSAGGLYSLPGYYTDSALGSKGVIVNEKLNMPPISIDSFDINYGLFYGYARLSSAHNISSITGIPDTIDLASIGPFISINRGSNLSFNFALGYKMKPVPTASEGKGFGGDVSVVVGF